MKKYILVALTLGLASPSYGASIGGDSDPTVEAFGLLRAQSCEGAFTQDIITALDLIPEGNRVVLARSVCNILTDTIVPQIGKLISAIYNLYEILHLDTPQRKAFEKIATAIATESDPEDILSLTQNLLERNGEEIKGLAEEMPVERDFRRAFLESLTEKPAMYAPADHEDIDDFSAVGALRHEPIAAPHAGEDEEAMLAAALAASLAPEEQVVLHYAPATAPRRAISAVAAAALQRDAQKRAATAAAVAYLRDPEDEAASAVGAPDRRHALSSRAPTNEEATRRVSAAQARHGANQASRDALLRQAATRQAAIEEDIADKKRAAQEKRMRDYQLAQGREAAAAADARRAAGNAAMARAATTHGPRAPEKPSYEELFDKLQTAVDNMRIARLEQNEAEWHKWNDTAESLNAEIARLTA